MKLGVNIDHVATLRQTRGGVYPDPVYAALLVEQAGADAVTVHLREDRRHIQERDVDIMRRTIQTRLNLEMAATDVMVAYALQIKPHDCCLVPERREELTTEGGLDVFGDQDRIRKVCAVLRSGNMKVSLFIDPDPRQIDAAAGCNADKIELHTGVYANAQTDEARDREIGKIAAAAAQGRDLGMQVNAGHGLNYQNVQAVARIMDIEELNIGHAVIARAVFSGLAPAVTEMKRLMLEARAL